MKAIVIHQYGGPEVLKFEDFPDPVAGAGEVVVRVAATSINPFDLQRRSGKAKDSAPIEFPGIVGVDLAGTVLEIGSKVENCSVGDKVFAMADRTYAERCVVKAENLVKIPDGIDAVEAAALPLVLTTGNNLISAGTNIQAGQTILIAGAVGNVGRSAVFAAKDRGATVIAGVRGNRLKEAASLGADQVIATDDDDAMANLPPLDAVADTVGGNTAEKLIAKVKPGGVFATVVGSPQNAGDYPNVKVVSVYTEADAKTLLFMAQAVKAGKLEIPIGQKMPLKDAGTGHAAVEKGGGGKVLLIVGEDEVKG